MTDRILITAFDGEDNSSRIILAKMKTDRKKIILPNHRQKSCGILKNELDSLTEKERLYIISMGQKPLIKNKISVEDTAKKDGNIIKINGNGIARLIRSSGYDCYISHNAGTSFCNELFYFGLEYIGRKQLSALMFFLHVPFYDKCDSDAAAAVLDRVADELIHIKERSQ